MKGEIGVNTYNLAAKVDLASIKALVDKSVIEKLKTVPAHISKLSTVVDNDVVRKTAYDKLVPKFNTINTKVPSTTGLVFKNLEKNIKDVDKKILNTSDLDLLQHNNYRNQKYDAYHY